MNNFENTAGDRKMEVVETSPLSTVKDQMNQVADEIMKEEKFATDRKKELEALGGKSPVLEKIIADTEAKIMQMRTSLSALLKKEDELQAARAKKYDVTGATDIWSDPGYRGGDNRATQ